MARQGQRKRSKQDIESLIAEILIQNPAEEYRDVDYKLRSDPVWRDRVPSGIKLPKIGTIKNYVSIVRKRLRSTGSDRPWSILASSNPDSRDFIPASDLSLVLKIWNIRLAHGETLTLRHARWISRLKHVVNLDKSEELNDDALSNIFYFAAMYASREIAVGEKNDSPTESAGGNDLDALIFRNFSSIENDSERDARFVAYEVGLHLGLFTLPFSDLTRPEESLVRTERRSQIIAEIKSLSPNARNRIYKIDQTSSSVLFLVLELLFKRSQWESESEDSQRDVVEKIVDAVGSKDWKSVATLARISIGRMNLFLSESISIEEDIDE